MGKLIDADKKAKLETEASLAAVNAALAEYAASSVVGIVEATINRTGAILTGVAKRSPVDQGYFRAAWGSGFAAIGESEPPLPTRTSIRADRVAAGRRDGTTTISETDDGVLITISNPARYGPFLEAGSSAQQRGGVIRPVLEEQRRQLRRDIERVRPKGVK